MQQCSDGTRERESGLEREVMSLTSGGKLHALKPKQTDVGGEDYDFGHELCISDRRLVYQKLISGINGNVVIVLVNLILNERSLKLQRTAITFIRSPKPKDLQFLRDL